MISERLTPVRRARSRKRWSISPGNRTHVRADAAVRERAGS